ncbi:MAG: hypothetical protein ACI4MU_13285 [Candidatus Ventricola sp.]
MINVTKKKDGLRVEVRGEMEALLDELAHAAYAAACGMLGAKDKKIAPEELAVFALALDEAIDLVYKDMTGDKRGYLDKCEVLMLLRMGNPDKLSEDVDKILRKRGLLQ